MSARFSFDGDSVRKMKTNVRAANERQVRRYMLALEAWADEAIGDIQAEISDVGAIDQGLLSAATTRTPARRAGTLLQVTIFNPLEYATIVEFGRRPKQGVPPPLLPLVGWAGRKGIIHTLPRNISFDGEWAKKWAASYAIWKNSKKGKRGSGKAKKPLDPVIRDMLIIRAIAAKIYEKGTKGRYPFTKAFDRRAATFTRDIASFVRLMA